MTKQDFIDICQDNIDELKERLETFPAEYLFYTDFLRDYNVKSIAGIVKIPYVDLASALIYPSVATDSLSEVLDATLGFRCVLEDLTSNQLDEVNQIFLSFIRSGDGEALEFLFNYPSTLEVVKKVKKIFSLHDSTAEDREHLKTVQDLMEKLILNNNQPGWDVLKLVKYYRETSNGMHNIIAIIRLMKKIKEENIDYTAKEFSERYRIDEILKVCNAIEMCKKTVTEDYKKYKASISHELTIYKKLKRDIESAFQKDEIINYEMIIHDIEDEELRRKFLYLVYEHNKVEYDRVELQNETLKKNSVVNYISVLKANNIKKDEVDLNKVMRNSCEDLDKMLKVLNGIVGDKNTIIRIIEFSDLMNVNYFKELKSNSVLGNSAFVRYPSIFDSSSNERKVLDKNIEIIKNYYIDFSLFNKVPDVLIENENLNENLEVLYNYTLLDKMNNTKKLKFLKNDNLIEKIDKIIELGYEEFLEEDLDLLNENNWDRIYVLKSMGLKPNTKSELLKYLRDDKFFISDNQLNLYMEDGSKYYDSLDISYDTDIARIVNDNNNGERSLNFDGVIISKNRVARNLHDNDFDINDFFRAIIVDSILSMDEVETIKSCLKNKTYKIG